MSILIMGLLVSETSFLSTATSLDSSLFPIFFVFGIRERFVEKLLFDETKHGSAIFCRPLQNILNLGVDNFVGEPAEFQTERTGYQDGDVVGHDAEEGAPEEDILPDPWNFAIYQHTSIAQLQTSHHPQLRKGTPAFAHIYSGIIIN